VLIVDDHAPFRRVARSVIEHVEGFEVVGEADTGESAIELAGRLSPDLVLMDVHLPGIDGVEAGRRLSVALANRPPVVVLLSTYEAGELLSALGESWSGAYLSKSELSPASLLALWASSRRAA
jgi:DNA-binding NarL/FixJ family response regulator